MYDVNVISILWDQLKVRTKTGDYRLSAGRRLLDQITLPLISADRIVKEVTDYTRKLLGQIYKLKECVGIVTESCARRFAQQISNTERGRKGSCSPN